MLWFPLVFICMHNKLFSSNLPELPDGELHYVGDYYAFAKADTLQRTIIEETKWRQNKIKLFGKEHLEPRLTQLYGDPKLNYGYSGIEFEPLPWTKTLALIKKDVEQLAQTDFNICLLNLYRDGNDSNGWHADDEKALGENPTIASVSFGEERFFHLKHNTLKQHRYKFKLEHGSVLIMSGGTQHFYKHQIAKTKKTIKPRLNLTFRKVISD